MMKKESQSRLPRAEVASTQARGTLTLERQQREIWRRNRITEINHELQQARTAYIDGRHEDAEKALKQILASLGAEVTDSLKGDDLLQFALIEASAASLLGRIRYFEGDAQAAQPHLATAASLFDHYFSKLQNPGSYQYGDYGTALWLLGRKEDAAAVLQQGVDNQDQNPDTYFFLGQIRHEQEQFAKARQLYHLALDLNPYYYPAVFALALVLEDLQETGEAAAAYQTAASLLYFDDPGIALMSVEQALRLEPDSAAALQIKGEILRLEGLYPEARKILERALQIDPGSIDAWFSLGILWSSSGEPEKSLDALDHALALDPENQYILIQRAVALRSMNRFDEALADLQRCTGSDARLPEAFLEMGETLRLMGIYEEALLSLNTALSIEPDYPWALGTIGQVLHALGRHQEAVQAMEHALELDPNLDWVYVELGSVWLDLQVYEKAQAAFDRALEIYPDSVEALLSKGRLLRKTEKPGDALPFIDRALELWPDSPWALRERGLVMAMLDDPFAALAALGRALISSPDNAYLRLEQAQLLYILGDYAEALNGVDQVLKWQPDWFLALFLKAELLRLLNRSHDAVQAYDKALEQEPQDIDSLRGKGYALLALFRNQDALDLFRQALALQPRDPVLITDLALAYKYLGDYVEAIALLEKALAIDSQDHWVLSTKGDVLCEIGDYQAAVKVLDQAIELVPDDSYTFTTKGWALENLGPDRAAEAVQAYQSALALDLPFPSDLWARKGLANAMRLQGDRQGAVAEYKSVIAEVEKQDVEIDVNLLPLVGWCHFQLALYDDPADHLDEAIDYFMETIALNSEMVSTQFDLALTLMCTRRRQRALREYVSSIERARQKQVLRRRGLLHVAIDDLEEAIAAVPAMKQAPEPRQALRLLKEAYEEALKEAPLSPAITAAIV